MHFITDFHTFVDSQNNVNANNLFIYKVLFLPLSVLPSLIDRLGDSKDQVRDQAQSLLLKIMDQAANPQVKRFCFAVCLGPNAGRFQT